MFKSLILTVALLAGSSAQASYCVCVEIQDGWFKGFDRLVRMKANGTVDNSVSLGIYRKNECKVAKRENPHCKK